MRLTLRTLLAWLDDTLSPSQVREIGQLVKDSQFARDLVDRTHRVTRQRRLTVPTGPEASDPNVVAAYIDNTLPADQVNEFERICLTSDVQLAEAASVHQILSLLGHKAKVPPEARQRMYRLVKGREAVTQQTIRKAPVPPVVKSHHVSSAPEPRTFAPLEASQRGPIERFGPAALAVALIGVLLASALYSLPSDRGPAVSRDEIPAIAEAPKPEVKPAAKPNDVPPPALTKVEAKPEPAPPTEEPEVAGLLNLPAGAIGGLAQSPGVVLREDEETKEWGRMKEGDALKADERVVNLDPFRDTFQVGKTRLEMVGAGEIHPLPNTADQKGRLHLDRGRILIGPLADGARLALAEAVGDVLITPPRDGRVGLERFYDAGKPSLDLLISEGNATVSIGDAVHELKGPGVFELAADAGAPTKTDEELPAWFLATEPTPFAKGIGEKFLSYFKEGRPTINVLTEAMDDTQKDVRQVAIATLGVLGEWSLMVPSLDKANDPLARTTAIEVLRGRLQGGGPGVEALQAEIMKVFGDEVGEVVQKLLLGFSEAESKADATYTQLVADLNAPELAVRQLAVDNLIRLTGRDDMEFDPDKPDATGLKNWQDWLVQRKANPANRR
ncbi:hypothetical protein EP7_003680 [Isosphaeraceae bacterium EP7]